MFSRAVTGLATRGAVLFIFIIVMGGLLIGSLQADGIIVKPPVWDCAITQLNPDNSYNDFYPVANRKYVVWKGWDGSDFEIFVQTRSTGVVTQITNNNLFDTDVQLGGHNVVWMVENPASGTMDIARYHIPTATTQLFSTAEVDDWIPQVEGNYIVWQRWGVNVKNIGIYNIATGVTSTLGYPAGTTTFTLHGFNDQRILYLRQTAEGLNSVETYTFATGTIKQLSNDLPDTNNKDQLAIDGDVVVFRSKPNNLGNSAYNVYAYNLATNSLIEVSADAHEDHNLAVSGNRIAFVKRNHLGPLTAEVFVHDLGIGTSDSLVVPSAPPNVTIDGSLVVVEEGYEMTIYDLEDGESKSFPNMLVGSFSIHNNQVFFSSAPGDGTDNEIYRADCGYVSDTIELPGSKLPSAGASFSEDAALPTPEGALVPLPLP